MEENLKQKMVNIHKKKKVSRLPKQKVVKLANSAWMWIVVYPKKVLKENETKNHHIHSIPLIWCR